MYSFIQLYTLLSNRIDIPINPIRSRCSLLDYLITINIISAIFYQIINMFLFLMMNKNVKYIHIRKQCVANIFFSHLLGLWYGYYIGGDKRKLDKSLE